MSAVSDVTAPPVLDLPYGSDIDVLLAHLDEALADVITRVLACFRTEIPAYATVPEPELRPGVVANFERAIRALRRGWEPMAAELLEARTLGERRAQQGLPLEALLQAHRIGVREALAFVRTEAGEHGLGTGPVLELATRAWAWADAVMLAAAAGHRERELGLASQEQQQRAHALRGLLLGGLDATGLRATAAYGVALNDEYAPLCADGTPDALHGFEQAVCTAAERTGAVILVGHLERGLAGLVGSTPDGRAPRSLIGQAVAAVADEVLVAVGPERRPAELSSSYELANRTLHAGRQLDRRGVIEIPDVPLHVGVLSEPEIGRLIDRRHLRSLDAEGEFGEQLLATAERWLELGMRTEECAAALHIHANTLRYRLRRLEELTGWSLDRTTDRFELWWGVTWRRFGLGGQPPRDQTPATS